MSAGDALNGPGPAPSSSGARRGVELRDGASVAVRRAERADVPILGDLWSECFPDGRSPDDRARELEDGRPYGGIETAWVGEVEGRLAGAFRAYSFQMHLFGRVFPALGLGAVAVAPDVRRRGVGEALVREALRVGRERGDALALLYPMRPAFYERVGFSLVGELHRYRFRPADLPLFPRREEVRRLRADDAGELRTFHGRTAAGCPGFLERSDAMWDEVLQPPRRAYGLGDPLEGYVVVEPQTGEGGEPRLHARELVASGFEAYRGLLGWLSAQRDPWTELVYDALPGEAFHRVLQEVRPMSGERVRGLWFPTAQLLRGPMARILDPEATLGSEVGLGAGSVLPLVDPVFPDNAGVWRRTEEGVSRASPEESGGGEGLPVGLVTELFLGGTLPGQADRLRGWEPVLGVADFRLPHEF